MNSNPKPAPMKRFLVLAMTASILLATCVGLSILAAQWVMQTETVVDPHAPMHGHQWLHEQLGLTEAESAAIDAFEGDYHQKKDALTAQFEARIAELRALLARQDAYSSEVDAAIHRLHEVHGALQELSIRHYYDMMGVLPPEKQAKLRELAVKALSQPE